MEPFKFVMDMDKVYSDANGLSAGRRVPFNVRVAFLLCQSLLTSHHSLWAM